MYRTPRDGITSWVYTEVEKVLSRERAISCCITEMTLMRLWQRISEVALQSSPSSRLFESIDIVVVVFNRSLRGPPHRPSAVPPTMVGQAGGQPGRRVVARRRIRHRLCIVVVAWRGVAWRAVAWRASMSRPISRNTVYPALSSKPALQPRFSSLHYYYTTAVRDISVHRCVMIGNSDAFKNCE